MKNSHLLEKLKDPQIKYTDILKEPDIITAFTSSNSQLLDYLQRNLTNIIENLGSYNEKEFDITAFFLSGRDVKILTNSLISNHVLIDKLFQSSIFSDKLSISKLDTIFDIFQTATLMESSIITSFFESSYMFYTLVNNLDCISCFYFLKSLIKHQNIEYSSFLIQILLTMNVTVIISDEDTERFQLNSNSMKYIKDNFHLQNYREFFKLCYEFSITHKTYLLFADLFIKILNSQYSMFLSDLDHDPYYSDKDTFNYILMTYCQLKFRSKENNDFSFEESYEEDQEIDLNLSSTQSMSSYEELLDKVLPITELEYLDYQVYMYFGEKFKEETNIWELGTHFVDSGLKYLAKYSRFNPAFVLHIIRMFIFAPFQRNDLDSRAAKLIPKATTVDLIIYMCQTFIVDEEQWNNFIKAIRNSLLFWESLGEHSRLSTSISLKIAEFVKTTDNEKIFDLPDEEDFKKNWETFENKYKELPFKDISIEPVESEIDQKYYEKGQRDFEKLTSNDNE
ncbi:hypothetical protein TVAG_353470 [Trichomonas vaginalis G3]|uniref:Uncharacterized protein n=1 Tax=Trichomonas vaginalis (strain ATCC PRA-98 / G3) TaxID=412133 RepID=A2EN69_TRIV3|nr:hypothetical protein TVAGG3_0546350 [Trichomonas vaginalis G3]EAY05906.1 hypothetical protein TVAG_353470 [Trichomonas vaginalis G3]KAI5520210.1 hypothetical protein TVAGG3_0546350 [Trichomonas vaginalis G3]|eukprot:XP_001318129.1 hypothetical protein [Trichomonas vaginalis G3]